MLYTLNFGLDGPDKLARHAGFRPLSRLKDTAFVLKQQEKRQKSEIIMGKSLLFANFAYICNLNKHQDEKDSFISAGPLLQLYHVGRRLDAHLPPQRRCEQ